MAGETAKIEKGKIPNTWIIGLVLIVLVLGGAGLYQMKQKNALQAKLDQKKEDKNSDSGSGSLSENSEQEGNDSNSSSGSLS